MCAKADMHRPTLNDGFMPRFLTPVFWYAPPRVICPSCQFAADLFACDVGQITGSFPCVFCPHEGRFAIVTKRGAGDAVDAGCRETSGAFARRSLLAETGVADGEVVAS